MSTIYRICLISERSASDVPKSEENVVKILSPGNGHCDSK